MGAARVFGYPALCEQAVRRNRPMREIGFAEMSAFAEVAAQKSFAKAAAQLGVSRSSLSETIRGIEDKLGVRLLNRTTRSVAPTEAGERLLARLAPILGDFK